MNHMESFKLIYFYPAVRYLLYQEEDKPFRAIGDDNLRVADVVSA